MENRSFVHENDKKTWTDKLDELQKQLYELKVKHVNEVSAINAGILSRD
jgi:hypothetical protein